MDNLKKTQREAVTLHQEAKKFKLFDEEDKKLLALSLQTLSFFIGIKNPIENQMLIMLVNHLVRFEEDFSIPELEQAVSLALAGQISANTIPYDGFSAQYLKQIIGAYREHRTQSIMAYREKIEEFEQQQVAEESKRNYDPHQAAISTFAIACARMVEQMGAAPAPKQEITPGTRGKTIVVGTGVADWQDAAAMIFLDKIGYFTPEEIKPLLHHAGVNQVSMVPSDMRCDFLRQHMLQMIDQRFGTDPKPKKTNFSLQQVYDQTMAYFTRKISNLKSTKL